MKKLFEFLAELEEKKIYFKLDKIRDSILVEVVIPGERWEVEFLKTVQSKLKNSRVMEKCIMRLKLI